MFGSFNQSSSPFNYGILQSALILNQVSKEYLLYFSKGLKLQIFLKF